MSVDFIPKKEPEQVEWAENLDANIDKFLVELGISEPQKVEIHAKIAKMFTDIDNYNQEKVLLKSLGTIKTDTKTDTFSFLREKIVRWKTEPGYTKAIGDMLRILGTSITLDPHTYKPKLAAEIKPGYILLTFVKAGVDGVNIYYRVKGTAEWKHLAYDTESPYMDAKPLASAGVPEVREYMAIGVISDVEFGGESDIISVVYEGAI
jgi:hypothetical protein